MHAAFLCRGEGRSGHGNCQCRQLAIYEEIPKDLLEQVEDVLLNRRPDATERLIQFAQTVKGEKNRGGKSQVA